jgi:hypothetical protein
VASRERDDLQPPSVVEPIFARQPDGRIAPQRLIWPSYWGELKNDTIEPLALARVQTAAKVLSRSKAKSAPTGPLSDEEIGMMLADLEKSPAPGKKFVYMRDGRVHERDASGKLTSSVHPAVRPSLWPLGHDVRPAAQSLGIRGCTDCHARDAPLYFGRVATGADDVVPIRAMHEVAMLDLRLARAWAAAFAFRPVVVWSGIACAAVLAVLLLRCAGQMLIGLACRLR